MPTRVLSVPSAVGPSTSSSTTAHIVHVLPATYRSAMLVCALSTFLMAFSSASGSKARPQDRAKAYVLSERAIGGVESVLVGALDEFDNGEEGGKRERGAWVPGVVGAVDGNGAKGRNRGDQTGYKSERRQGEGFAPRGVGLESAGALAWTSPEAQGETRSTAIASDSNSNTGHRHGYTRRPSTPPEHGWATSDQFAGKPLPVAPSTAQGGTHARSASSNQGRQPGDARRPPTPHGDAHARVPSATGPLRAAPTAYVAEASSLSTARAPEPTTWPAGFVITGDGNGATGGPHGHAHARVPPTADLLRAPPAAYAGSSLLPTTRAPEPQSQPQRPSSASPPPTIYVRGPSPVGPRAPTPASDSDGVLPIYAIYASRGRRRAPLRGWEKPRSPVTAAFPARWTAEVADAGVHVRGQRFVAAGPVLQPVRALVLEMGRSRPGALEMGRSSPDLRVFPGAGMGGLDGERNGNGNEARRRRWPFWGR
ncbi:hypothetical protein B0H12DRAFT_238918 [Mycena haematopus]|nr:hypothetical protein B0H12DRAFT_238918 [Mycena haematopus]